MSFLRNALIVLLLGSTTAIAAPASENSIKQLLAVTEAQNLVGGMRAQFDAMMTTTMQQALKGRVPNSREQQTINDMKNKMVALLQEQLAWEKLEPMYLRLYRESFTEEEVTGMLSFYRTPAGQAVIHKMPALMQKTMLEVQHIIVGVTPQMQKIQHDFVTELKAASQ